MTEVPKSCFQNTHMEFHICYTSQSIASHYHGIRLNMCMIPKNWFHESHGRQSGFLKKFEKKIKVEPWYE